jgi:hypothetical protein
MSSTNRGGQRIENDVYSTPAWCVHRLLEACPLPAGRWLEPAAGEGAIIKAVNEKRSDVLWSAVDLRDTFADLQQIPVSQAILTGHDFLGLDMSDLAPFDVILTNPPYSLAEEFVQRSLGLADNVAMLLRLNFLGSEARSDFLRRQPPDVYVLPNRPSFVGGKTDSCEYAWFVWRGNQRLTFPRHGGISVLAPTPRDERKR